MEKQNMYDKLAKALEAYEKWEANLLNSDGPSFEYLSQELQDELHECQKLRNEALKGYTIMCHIAANEEVNKIVYSNKDSLPNLMIEDYDKKILKLQHVLTAKFLFKIGDNVIKSGGDYTFEGKVVSVFQKLGGSIRYVVEDSRGLLFIFNKASLVKKDS